MTGSENLELHWRAQAGDLAGVRDLVEGGAALDAFDDVGKAPLHYAAEGEHLDVVLLRAIDGEVGGQGG